MNIRCNSKELSEAVINVQRAVSDKSTLAALEGILLKAEYNNLYLCGYNLELGISTNLTTQVAETGEIILNARLLSDILRKIPGEIVEISTDNKNLTTIKSDNSNFSIVGIAAEEYPNLPEIIDDIGLNIDGNILKEMIKQTIFAVSDNDTNPIHTGILFEIYDDEIKLVAVDGYRLALRKEKVNLKENITEKISFVVPGKTLNEILKLINENDKVNILIDKKHIIFNINGYKVISRLLEGKFLDYNAAIPNGSSTVVRVNTRDFINSVERVSLIIADRLKSPLRCIFKENEIKLSCTTAIGKASDEIIAPCRGEELEIGFNNRYLLDALKNSGTDEVRVELINALSPMKVMPKDGDNFVFLVLPVRLKY